MKYYPFICYTFIQYQHTKPEANQKYLIKDMINQPFYKLGQFLLNIVMVLIIEFIFSPLVTCLILNHPLSKSNAIRDKKLKQF